MGVMAKIYGVSVSLCPKLAIFGKTVPMDFEREFEFFKT
jgi:hypothetical protein